MMRFKSPYRFYLLGWFLFIWAAYSLLTLLSYWHFGPGIDLSVFSQVVFHYSRFKAPSASIIGNPNLLGDHFHPILAVLAPLYWFFPSSQVMLIAQAFLASVAVFPVFLFAEKRLGGLAALLFSISYSIYWGLQLLVSYDFHEVAFAVPLIALAIYFLDENKMKPLFACLLLLMCVKEDQCFFAAFVGIYLMVVKRQWKIGLAGFLMAIAGFLLITNVLMPYFGKGPFHQFYYYARFGKTPLEAFLTVLKKPYLLFVVPFDDITKLKVGFYTFHPFLLFSFFSPLILLTFPLLGERFLSDEWHLFVFAFHYAGTVAPVVAMTSADGLYNILKFIRKDEWKKKIPVYAGVTILVLNLALFPKFPFWNFSHSSFFEISGSDKTGYKALKLIPPEASVLAQDCIGPHLCNREAAVEIFQKNMPDCDYVIASKNLNPWPNDNWNQIEGLLQEKLKKGYEKIFDENGWVVLRKKKTGF